ncbi:Nif3-like dinuclear metal center hexameric protein [candidate division WOR-3 bacterium]|nr:Nif3-like dinuclear metal center hexameric protein [candidate division WOR-3 bacterium]
MKRWVPEACAHAGYDYQEVFEAGFCEKFNGLMLKAGSDVQHVFCSAFATPDVMRSILDSGTTDALLFLHHPLDMEVCGVGFLPVPQSVITELQKNRISIYSCHAPLDCHDEIGTNAAIVQALNVTVEKSYIEYGIGYAGRIGTIERENTASLLKKVREIFGVSRLEVGGCLNREVTRIAIVAGGGDDPEYLKQAHDNSCDMYLSGEWYPRYTPEDEEGKERVARVKEEINEFSRNTRMVLVGVSHAASEFLVMKTQMKDYFESKDLPTTPIPQQNWWR